MEGNFSFIGGFGGGEVNSGMMFVSLKEPRDRPVDEKAGHRLSQQELMDVVRGATGSIPGIRAALVDPSQQGFSTSRGGGFPIELSIRGRDWNALAGYSRQIMEEMAQSGKVTDVNSDYQVGMPEVRVVPDRNKAADLERQHGGHRADRQRRHRRHAGGQVQGERPAVRHPGAPAGPAARSGRRTSAACTCAGPRAPWCGCPTS